MTILKNIFWGDDGNIWIPVSSIMDGGEVWTKYIKYSQPDKLGYVTLLGFEKIPSDVVSGGRDIQVTGIKYKGV